MSDTEGTGGSDGEEVLEFKCRKCPGKTFTAAEKDAHRMLHREQKEKEKKKGRPGPKSKTRASLRRDTSPAASAVTLFEPIGDSQASTSQPTRGRRKAETQAAGPKSKRKSKKTYDDDAIGVWSRGNGA